MDQKPGVLRNPWNEMGMERVMFTIKWRDKKKVSWIREQTKV